MLFYQIIITGRLPRGQLCWYCFTHGLCGWFFVLLPLAVKLLTGLEKHWRGWNDGTDLLYRHARYAGNQTTNVGVRRQSVMFFIVMLTPFDGVGNVVNSSTRRSVSFSGPILTMFTAFFGEDKPLPVGNKFEKLLIHGTTISAPVTE